MSAALLVPVALLGLCLVMSAGGPRLLARKERQRQKRLARAKALIRRRIHAINPTRCTGCQACVDVCPTGTLGLVEHTTKVLFSDRCLECTQCAQVCPNSALVMHREGEQLPPVRLPEIDESLQSAVPGQYLVGAVTGRPLVKNAANMGRAVVEHMMASGLEPGAGSGDSPDNPLDVAIVGSGPGGLSAALTCHHYKLSVVVFEKDPFIASTVSRYPKGKHFLAEPLDCRNLSFLPLFDTSKEVLVETWNRMVKVAGLDVRTSTPVDGVTRRDDGLFEITVAKQTVFARRTVLAIGTRGKPRTLGVPGESHVKVATMLDDAAVHQGQSVLVVGGGDSALEALRRSGLTHFVAVSGSNVALFLAGWWVLTAPFGLGPKRRAVFGFVALVVFVVATRWEASVVRAAVMAGIVLGGSAAGIAVDAWLALGSAVTLLLLVSGHLAADVGVPAVGGRHPGDPGGGPALFGEKRPRWLWTPLGATVAAQAAVVPILLLHFGTVPLLSPVANLVAGPFVAAATVVGAVGVFTGLGAVVAAGVGAGGCRVLAIAHLAAGLAPARRRRALAAAVVAGVAAGRAPLRPWIVLGAIDRACHAARPSDRDRRRWRLSTFVDVGQGDAVLRSGSIRVGRRRRRWARPGGVR